MRISFLIASREMNKRCQKARLHLIDSIIQFTSLVAMNDMHFCNERSTQMGQKRVKIQLC